MEQFNKLQVEESRKEKDTSGSHESSLLERNIKKRLELPADQSLTEEYAKELIKQGKFSESEHIFRALISKGEGTHTVYGNLAAICGMQNRFDEVIELLHNALVIKPDYVEAHYNLGVALKKQGYLEAAIAAYKTALKLENEHPKIHYSLGIALYQQGDLDTAVKEFKIALKLKDNYPEAHYNLGVSLKKQGDHIGAITSYKAALKYKPDYPKAHYNLGNVFQETGNLIDAIASFKSALKLKPNYPKANLNLAMAELLFGDYESGLKRYECRFINEEYRNILNVVPPCKLWDGDINLKDNKLLLVGEQGLGDTLQFMRYVTVIRNQGIPIALCAQPKLHTLIKTSGIDQAPLTPEQAKNFNEGRWIPLLSLLRHLKVSPNNPIITKPYIKATDERIDKWQRILARERKPVIGINWQGNPSHETTNSKGRSIPLESFRTIAKLYNGSLLSLQKGEGSEQLPRCSFKDQFVRCQNQVNENWDFLDAAAIIANCDLVITSDTSVAHLAGGMGKTTWLLLKKVPEWRWGLEGESTFWYPSMRLFRQNESGCWQEVMQKVANALIEEFPGNASRNDWHI